MDVICDSSFLMVLVSSPIRQLDRVESYLGKLRFLVPDVVIEELERLEKKAGPKRAMIAKTAIELSKSRFSIVKTPHARHADDSIVDFAVSSRCAAATLDADLKRRLISNGILVLSLSKNRLIIANPKPEEQF